MSLGGTKNEIPPYYYYITFVVSRISGEKHFMLQRENIDSAKLYNTFYPMFQKYHRKKILKHL